MADSDLQQYTGQSCSWYDVPCHLSSFAEWLKEFLLFLPRKIFEEIAEFLAAKLEQLPAIPGDAASKMSALFSNAEVNYVLSLFQVGEGIMIILAALAIRFTIRRIPLIG